MLDGVYPSCDSIIRGVRTAIDGEIALALVRQRMPDVIVTDLDMPKMNGIELCMYRRGMRTADRTGLVRSLAAGRR